MVKRTIALLFWMAIAQASVAQSGFGVKGGVSWVTLDVNSDNPFYEKWGYHFRPGFQFGLYSKFDISNKLFLQPEIQFSNKGYSYSVASEDSKAFKHLNYLTLPVLVGLKVGQKFELLAGPEIGYLLNGEEWNNKIDLGLSIGANFFVSEAIFLGTYYSHGLVNVMNKDRYQLPTNEKVTFNNRVFQFSMGYRLK